MAQPLSCQLEFRKEKPVADKSTRGLVKFQRHHTEDVGQTPTVLGV